MPDFTRLHSLARASSWRERIEPKGRGARVNSISHAELTHANVCVNPKPAGCVPVYFASPLFPHSTHTCIVHSLPSLKHADADRSTRQTIPPSLHPSSCACFARLTHVSTIPILSACPNALPQLGHFRLRFQSPRQPGSRPSRCSESLRCSTMYGKAMNVAELV